MANDIPKVVKSEQFYEVVEMSREIAELSDKALFELIKSGSDEFKKTISHMCLLEGVSEFNKAKLEALKAAEAGLILYKGIWVAPITILPQRFTKCIDEFGSPLERLKG